VYSQRHCGKFHRRQNLTCSNCTLPYRLNSVRRSSFIFKRRVWWIRTRWCSVCRRFSSIGICARLHCLISRSSSSSISLPAMPKAILCESSATSSRRTPPSRRSCSPSPFPPQTKRQCTWRTCTATVRRASSGASLLRARRTSPRFRCRTFSGRTALTCLACSTTGWNSLRFAGCFWPSVSLHSSCSLKSSRNSRSPQGSSQTPSSEAVPSTMKRPPTKTSLKARWRRTLSPPKSPSTGYSGRCAPLTAHTSTSAWTWKSTCSTFHSLYSRLATFARALHHFPVWGWTHSLSFFCKITQVTSWTWTTRARWSLSSGTKRSWVGGDL